MRQGRYRELVDRWYKLDITSEDDLPEIEKRIDDACSVVSKTLGRHLIPAYPLHVLSIVQTIHAANDTNSIEGTTGFVYKNLIDQQLIRTCENSRNIDMYRVFLEELAYSIWTKKDPDRALLKEDFDRLVSDFCESRGLDVQASIRLDVLINGRMLVRIVDDQGSDKFRFVHPYLRYYFLAEYLAFNSANDTELIEELASNIQIDENFNIVSFWMYHSLNRTLLEKIIEKADGAFQGQAQLGKPSEYASLVKLKSGKLNIALPQDIAEVRREYLSHGEDAEDDHLNEIEKMRESWGDDFLKELSSALRSQRILGQTLRTFQGNLKAREKERIVATTLACGLRLSGFIIQVGKPVVEKISELAKIIKSNVNDGEQTVSVKTLDFVSSFIEEQREFYWNHVLPIAAVTRRTTESICAENLTGLYSNVLSGKTSGGPFCLDSSVATLLETSLSIQSNPRWPVDQIRKFLTANNSHEFIVDVFRIVSFMHAMRFGFPDYKTRQTVCSLLEIKDSTGLLPEFRIAPRE